LQIKLKELDKSILTKKRGFVMAITSSEKANNDRHMTPLTLINIAKACGGIYVGDESKKNETITGAVTDSRQVEAGYLFIAIKGERVDGHDYVSQVFEKGALAVISERELSNPTGPYIQVESSTDALKKLAAFYRENLSIPVIGIIGSVGKTSTKEMVASVLSQKYNVLKTAGNFNNEIGLPLTILRIHKEHEVAVLEMGISDFGEMHRLGAIAKPDMVVMTNIGCCHLENLKTRDGILSAKTEVFEHMPESGIAILNGDDDKLTTKPSVNGNPSVFYGIDELSSFEDDIKGETSKRQIKKAVYASNLINLGFDGIKADFHTPSGDFNAWIHIPGEHNISNALAATAAALKLGLGLDEIKAGIEEARTIAGRTNFIHTNGITIIDDCYNANPVSMNSAIETLSHGTGRTIAVLGDMGELGADEANMHALVGSCVGEKKIPVLFCAGKLAVNYMTAAKNVNPACDIHYYEDRESMTRDLLGFVKKGDTILVKASHFMDFPKVVAALEGLDTIH
jgi:UDP-N-acetylmuramoyl-tripeptide--D-alanyl-D-alanine ligase